ncbi:ABC transporter ATP-binding protein [Hoyosella subflava]|uniref:Branched-chain amino acid ABC superfamily ATP binding cassette transporter, ABC protein n=1 Tax=Hoyosella subflava (strain DSM 45089 / JCM 17490 / NBRC 109087 / DQS3-9A1) TaxID=443218 RepID=F6EHM7_HOYSD|nr:ABC transporter ATP-binding protein [Hoyosella subflava]AEF42391.1 Branched-chain amino acid ABC superfamily ATP binding cassette transporter, ABC protein [Hoyosella subflava DQS3-9A1]
MLSVQNLEIVYEDVILVSKGVSLEVPREGIVALLGGNGAGKTSTLRAITGLLDIHRGRITAGKVVLDGTDITERSPSEVVASGISQVMEGRRVFVDFTVEENLRVGAHTQPRTTIAENLDRVYTMFPILAERRKSGAGYLSGGEQQMLAIGRALMAQPTYLLLDEPSLGLAPRIVEQIRDLIVQINKAGTGVLLVEQNAAMALSIASHGYVMENGRVVMDAPAETLRNDSDIREFYLGLSKEGAGVSYRDIKHYKRRKRWLS